jgi:hypothetical protein
MEKKTAERKGIIQRLNDIEINRFKRKLRKKIREEVDWTTEEVIKIIDSIT